MYLSFLTRTMNHNLVSTEFLTRGIVMLNYLGHYIYQCVFVKSFYREPDLVHH